MIPPAKGKQYCPCPTEETLTHHASGSQPQRASHSPQKQPTALRLGDKMRVPGRSEARARVEHWRGGGWLRRGPREDGTRGADRGGGCARLWQSHLVRSTRAAYGYECHTSVKLLGVCTAALETAQLRRLTVGVPG